MAIHAPSTHLFKHEMARQAAPPTKYNTMKNRYLKQSLLLISMAVLNQSAFAEESTADKPATGEISTVAPGSLTTVIADSATFSILTKALKAAKLDLTLGSKEEFTIFAPTDEAFGKLPEGTLAKLLLPENKEKLRMLLLYHVVAGKVLAANLTDGEIKTVNGEKIKVEVSDDKIEVDGNKVFSADVSATNGVMHSVGVVLVPDSLDGFVGLDN
jgi:uncharacterized surface protein with fasciclin (FAS1) repeats